MNHITVTTKVYRDNSMRTFDTKTIFIEKEGRLVPFYQLLNYQMSYIDKSKTWHDKLLLAISLFFDYINANYNCYSSPSEFFGTFIDAIYMGTINEDGNDPSGLFWLPKKIQNANQLLSMLNNFTDWLGENYGTQSLNPWKKANSYEQYIALYANLRKSENSLLGHLDEYTTISNNSRFVRNTLYRKAPTSNKASTKIFPEDKIMDLLWIGFRKSRKNKCLDLIDQYNWRDMAITILMIGGGLRNSEPFHLWIQDVIPNPNDPQSAIVRVYHPSEGKVPEGLSLPSTQKIIKDRASYLLIKYGLMPRNLYTSSDIRHAGWKDPRLDNQEDAYMNVYWFEPTWGRIFMTVWKMYMIKRIREGISDTSHPYAFVSLSEKNKGEMLSMESFRDSYKKAVEKIGLTLSKRNGTTPHGLRHAYGQRLEKYIPNNESKKLIIQMAMHHKSEKSQDVYTAPTVEIVTKTLQKALQQINTDTNLNGNLEEINDWLDKNI